MLVVAILVVPLTRGSFRRLSQLQFRHLWLLLVALIVQIVLEYVDFPKDRMEDLGVAILLGSYVLIFGFCWINRKVKGMTHRRSGIACNVLVIALNLGMPTTRELRTVDGHDVYVPIEQTVKHRPEDDDTKLAFLGDVMTLPGSPNQLVLDRRHHHRPRHRRRVLRGEPGARDDAGTRLAGSDAVSGSATVSSSRPRRSSTTSSAASTRVS